MRQYVVVGDGDIRRPFKRPVFLEAHQHVAGNKLGPAAFFTWARLKIGRGRVHGSRTRGEGDQR